MGRLGWLTLVTVFALVVAACGGTTDSAAPTTDTSPAQTATVPAATVPAATVPAATVPAATVPATGSAGFATFDPPPPNRNWLQVSTGSGSSLEGEPELCLILSDGAEGKINMVNLALEWSGGSWTLIWNNAEGSYDGQVDGMVDGITATFEGTADGVAVRGSVACYEA